MSITPKKREFRVQLDRCIKDMYKTAIPEIYKIRKSREEHYTRRKLIRDLKAHRIKLDEIDGALPRDPCTHKKVSTSEFERGFRGLTFTRKEKELITLWLKNPNKIPEMILKKSQLQGRIRYSLLIKTIFVILNICGFLDPIRRIIEIAGSSISLKDARDKPARFLRLLLCQEEEILKILPTPLNLKLQMILQSFRKNWRIRGKPSTQ